MKNNRKSNRLAYIEGILSIFLNTILFILKLWVGMASGSVAIIADAWHTLSDSITSIIIVGGFKMSEKNSDNEHPFGHGRYENVISLIISVLLAVVAFNFAKDSIVKLIHRESAVFSTAAIIVFIISAFSKEAIARFSFKASKIIDSHALEADGWHHRSDAIASLLILAGVFAGKYLWWIDGVLGIAICLIILYAAFGIMKDTVNKLLGENPDDETVDIIKNIAEETAKIPVNVHHIHLHCYGYHKEVTFHIMFEVKISLEAAHDYATRIENVLRNRHSIYATIHLEPKKTK